VALAVAEHMEKAGLEAGRSCGLMSEIEQACYWNLLHEGFGV